LADDVRAVAAIMPAGEAVGSFRVEVRGEAVAIPERIHHPEPAADAAHALTGAQRVVLHCLYSRHHDGRVRQRHAERVVASTEPWVVPFVVRLAGEYVLEIVQAIAHGLPDLAVPGSVHRGLYGEFVVRNPAFFALTQRRVVSYWTCYYRRTYPAFGTYPAAVLAEAIRSAASEAAGAEWPRHMPPVSVGRPPAPRSPA
jgi:hypothetical protein